MTIDILHVTPYMHPSAGGPPVVVDRLCRQLVADGWNVQVITTDTGARGLNPSWAEAYRDGYPLSVHASHGPAHFGYSPSLRHAMENRVGHSRIVHVHGLWTYPGWCAMRTCRRLGVPYVVMPHGMLDPFAIRRKWFKKRLYGRALEWPGLRRASRMVYTHEEERRLAESVVPGLPPGVVAPLGSDPPPQVPRDVLAEEFFAAQPHLRGCRLVAFLGRLHPKKGLDLLIPAFAQLVKAMPDARIVFIGDGDAIYVRQLHRWIADSGVELQATFTGSLSGRAKWAALAAAAVLALPSYQENFGLVVVEAMALGIPVIVSARVNLWRDVVEAKAGIACDLDASSVSTAIAHYLGDPTAAAEAGCHGQHVVHDHFNWPHHAQLVEHAYQEILNPEP